MTAQIIANFMTTSMLYMLVASGLAIIFGVMRIINFAHGHLVMLGAYFVFSAATHLGLSYGLALAVAVLGVGVIAILSERGLLARLRGNTISQIVISVGILYIIEGSVVLVFGPQEQNIKVPIAKALRFGGVVLAGDRVMAIAVGLLAMTLLLWFISKTTQGKAMRATVQDEQAAKLVGIDPVRMATMAMGIGGGLAALSGALTGGIFYVSPYMAFSAIIKSQIVITLGGMGSIGGTMLGAIIIGLVETIGFMYLGDLVDILGFIAVMVILIIRPQGLFGAPYELAQGHR